MRRAPAPSPSTRRLARSANDQQRHRGFIQRHRHRHGQSDRRPARHQHGGPRRRHGHPRDPERNSRQHCHHEQHDLLDRQWRVCAGSKTQPAPARLRCTTAGAIDSSNAGIIAATSSTNAASTVTVNAGHNIKSVGVTGVDVTGGGGLATVNQTGGILTGADGISAVASNGAGGVLVNATGGSIVATGLGINAAGAVRVRHHRERGSDHGRRSYDQCRRYRHPGADAECRSDRQ